MLNQRVTELIDKVRKANNPQLTFSVICGMIKTLYELISIFEIQVMQAQQSSNTSKTK